jgi:hypothetical protein
MAVRLTWVVWATKKIKRLFFKIRLLKNPAWFITGGVFTFIKKRKCLVSNIFLDPAMYYYVAFVAPAP